MAREIRVGSTLSWRQIPAHRGGHVKKRLVAATMVIGAIAVLAAPSYAAPSASVCAHLQVSVNGTTQVVDKCVP